MPLDAYIQWDAAVLQVMRSLSEFPARSIASARPDWCLCSGSKDPVRIKSLVVAG